MTTKSKKELLVLKIKPICIMTTLIAFLVSCLASDAQTVNDEKDRIPQPIKAVSHPPNFVVKPQVLSEKEKAALNSEKTKPNEPDFGPYMVELQRRIKRIWPRPQSWQHYRSPVLAFKIHKDGSISGLRLAHSSGDEAHDKAALEALQKAAPFSPLPPGSKDEEEIQFVNESCPIFSRRSKWLPP